MHLLMLFCFKAHVVKHLHRLLGTPVTVPGTGSKVTKKPEQKVQVAKKPKRKVTRPTYLKDYA